VIAGGRLVPGDVVLHYDYGFSDGSRVESKFLVIVGERSANASVLYFLTTTQHKHGRERKPGCQIQFQFPSAFYLIKQNGRFNEDCWVVLEPLQIKSEELALRLTSGRGLRRFTLANSDFQGVMNCFKRSQDFSPIYSEFK